MTHIEAWLSGSYTTAQLHAELTDSEYLRFIREDYYFELIDRYDPHYECWGNYRCHCDCCLLSRAVEAQWTAAFEDKKAETYSLSTAEGCEVEWSHGGFAS